MKLPPGWSAERHPGYAEVHTLIHDPCGFTSARPYDLILDQSAARRCVVSHECSESR